MQRVWTRTVRANPCGRDLVVGDVHGCFRTLDRALTELRFDTDSDRLFGVGDLVDRGPHSAEALVWLETRFEAVVMGDRERPLLYWFDPHRRPSSLRRPDWLRRVPRTLVIDYDRRRATVAGREAELTATEYELLRALSLNAGRVTTSETLLNRVWPERSNGDTKVVRAFVKQLRRKLGDDAASPAWIFNERGVGYRMPRPGAPDEP